MRDEEQLEPSMGPANIGEADRWVSTTRNLAKQRMSATSTVRAHRHRSCPEPQCANRLGDHEIPLGGANTVSAGSWAQRDPTEASIRSLACAGANRRDADRRGDSIERDRPWSLHQRATRIATDDSRVHPHGPARSARPIDAHGLRRRLQHTNTASVGRPFSSSTSSGRTGPTSGSDVDDRPCHQR